MIVAGGLGLDATLGSTSLMMNFMWPDIVGVARAIAGFAAILFAPGYVLAYAVNLFGFRTRTLLERLAWAVSLSFAASPILAVLLGRLMPLGAIAILFAIVAIAALALIAIKGRPLRIPACKYTILLALFVVLGAAAIVASMIDLQQGNRLYVSVSVIDQAYRVAFTNGIAHTGIPPLNPLYRPGAAAPMRYYYFWYTLCAVCMKLADVSARQALMASSCWAGLGLVAAIALFARHFLEVRGRLYRFILVAALLLTVTGLDIMPGLYNLVHDDFRGDMEWWSTDQISSWFDSIVWVPNHTSSLLCCLAAFLLLWRTRTAQRPDRIAATTIAGVAAASAFGLSIYVAAGFAMLMLGWSAVLLLRARDTNLVVRNCAAAGVATVLLIPYLRDLLGSHSGTEARASAGAAHLFQFSVREMIDSSLITRWPVFSSLNRSHPVLLDRCIRLVLLLPGYALELGMYGLVLILAIAARKSLAPPCRTALGLILGGMVMVSFLRSSVIGNNDFGYRAALIPCFFLLLLAADKFTTQGPKPWLTLLLLAGLASTAFQALMLRIYVPLHVAARTPGFDGQPEAAYAARTAYSSAADVIPGNATIQSNLIDPESYFYVMNMLYSERSMVTDASVDCGSVFGGDPARCTDLQASVRSFFASPAPSAADAVARCRALGIDYLSVARSDPAWEDKGGWVWSLPEAAPQPAGMKGPIPFRVLRCNTLPVPQP